MEPELATEAKVGVEGVPVTVDDEEPLADLIAVLELAAEWEPSDGMGGGGALVG